MAKREIFFGFDALRGVAAIAVLFFHSGETLGTLTLAPSGYLAVDLFFVLSGFVVAHAYEQHIPVIGISGFMKTRIIRFLPLFYVGGLIGILRLGLLLFTHHQPDIGVLGIISYFFFLPAPPTASVSGSLTPLNGVGWSLIFEIYINLAYAMFLPYLYNRVLAVFTTAAGIGLFVALITGHEFGAGVHWNEACLSFLRVNFSFPLGLLVYRHRDKFSCGHSSNIVLIIFFWVAVSVPASPLWDVVFIFMVSPALVIFALRCGANNQVARYGARASYCIYAIHLPIISIAIGVGRNLPMLGPYITALATAFIIIVAPLLEKSFDLPTRRYLGRRFTASHRSNIAI